MTDQNPPDRERTVLSRKRVTRREALGFLGVAAVAGLGVVAGCSSDDGATGTPTATADPTETLGATTAATTSSGTATAAATAAATTAAAISCVATPAETEGPYFVDELLNRSDIRSDPTTGAAVDGIPLSLTMRVYKIGDSCQPLAGAHVDIWHCNAEGLYSDESANNTVGQKFLRGYQVTDDAGAVTFTTIYPGWYSGRTVHIHFKVRTYDGSSKTYEFTSQLFFDDTLSDQVFAQAPYNARGNRDTRNANDNIFLGGNSMNLLSLSPSGDGYATTFDVGLQM